MHIDPLILCIDTSTALCSISFSRGPEIIDEEIYSKEDRRHAALLPLIIETVRKRAGITLDELAAIGCSMGPGSYTGLRVGLATVKGLCISLNKPLIGISTLEALSYSISGELSPSSTRIIAMVDAGRDEVYHGVFDINHQLLDEVSPLILKEDTFKYLLDQGHTLIVVGDGVSKAKKLLASHPRLNYGQEEMVASLLRIPVFKKFVEGNFENIAYSVPKYIKAPHYKKHI